MNIQTPVTTNANATVHEAADQTISLIQGSVGIVDPAQKVVIETEAKVLDRIGNLTIGAQNAERFYVSVPRPEGSRLVKGYTIFKPSSTQYVVFELICGEADLPRIRPIYEATIASSEFLDPTALNTARGASIKSGVAFFAALSDEDYAAVMGRDEIWHRLYQPAPGGAPMDAEEIGYRGVKFWNGKRGEVDPNKPRNKWGEADSQEGLLCQIRARVHTDVGWADTRGTYFLSRDRSEEVWFVETALRDDKGKASATASETGARRGTEMNVVQSGAEQKPRRPVVPAEGYLSQLDSYLLPRLIVRKQVQTELAFYAYQPQTGTVALRRDTLARDSSHTGAWTLTTRFAEERAPQVSIYNDRGELIRTTLDDGRIWEPIDPATLMQLWKQKGLPTGEDDGKRPAPKRR